MKTKNLILILIILGLIALSGGYAMGLFNSGTETAENIVRETENDSDSLSEQDESDSITETDIKDETKEDVLEKEEDYADEDKNNDDEKDTASFIEEGLVAYYPFNDDTKDYSSDGKDGTNHGAVFVEGKKGEALKFDGKNDFVYAPVNINPIPMPRMTMAAWVKAEDDTKIRKAVCHDNSGYDRCMGIDNRQGGQGWSCFAGDGKILGYSSVLVDKWTFVAAVYDQNAGTVKLFVDGSMHEKKGKIVGSGNDFILIGANGSTKLQREYFMGAIDEVKIYDYALSDKELNSLYETGIAKPKTEL